jgi:hypothetical protein
MPSLQSLNRTIEHQHVIQSLNSKLIAVESQCTSQNVQVKTLTAAVAAAAAAVEISERR